MTTLPDFARRHALERPDAPAVVDTYAAEVWSWADLDRRAAAIGAAISEALTACGLGPADRVGLAVGATALGIAALHGVPRAGVAAVLVHPRLTAPEVAALLADARCRVLVVDPATGVVPPSDVAVVRLDEVAGDAATQRATLPPAEFIVPTSGTTARPKLVRLPMDRLAASAEAWNTFLPPATGWLLSLGLAHVAGLGIAWRAAASGAPIVIPTDVDPEAVLAAIHEASSKGVVVSHLSLVAAQLLGLLDATGDAPPPEGIRAVILGGGPIPVALVQRAVAAGWPVVPSYGMTETASGVVALPATQAAANPGTVGHPLHGVELRLANGEIQVRGPMVFAGYLDDPAATNAATTLDGWLRTGDLGRLDADGRLTIDGRSDELIVSGGENVSPAEIEAALASHPGVREVAVVGAPDARWGHVPVAIIVEEPDAKPSDDDLTAHARTRLANFKVPSRYVRVAALEHTSLGKVERRQLHRLARQGAPTTMTITTDDAQQLAIRDLDRTTPGEAPVAVLLHATVTDSKQLLPLAGHLADRYRVVLIDRRGTAASPMADPAPVPVVRHVADVIAVLDGLGIDRAVVVGHSFGGVIALSVAAEHGDRVAGVVVWEPPYLALADPGLRAAMAAMADDVAAAFASGGPEGAARAFQDGLGGPGTWERLRPRQREAIALQGGSALADVAMPGLTADGLARITAPTIIATGGGADAFYTLIADALAGLIGTAATRVELPGLSHMAPITNAAAIADLVRRLAAAPEPQETPP